MDAWAYVAANMPVPLAMGERLYTIYQFQDLLNHQGAAYVRPDLSLAGGITNVKKIAAPVAEAHYVGVAPHNPLSCVLTAACVQIDAAVHNGRHNRQALMRTAMWSNGTSVSAALSIRP